MKKLLVITLLAHSIFTAAMQQDMVEIVDAFTGQVVRMTEDEYIEQQANNHDLGPAERYRPERILELQRIFNVRDQSALDRLYAQELAGSEKAIS